MRAEASAFAESLRPLLEADEVHGAIGFALESGLHRPYLRARSAASWVQAVCAAAR